MKRLLFILIILISIGSYAQNDTTVLFEKYTVEKYLPEIIKESEFKTIDTVDFDIEADSTSWFVSDWRKKDSIYVNANKYRIIQIQKRMNDQGIKQRKRRVILYTKKTINKRRIKH